MPARPALAGSSIVPSTLGLAVPSTADNAQIQALENLGQQSAEVISALEATMDVAEMNLFKETIGAPGIAPLNARSMQKQVSTKRWK